MVNVEKLRKDRAALMEEHSALTVALNFAKGQAELDKLRLHWMLAGNSIAELSILIIIEEMP